MTNPNRKFTRRQINATLAGNGVPKGPPADLQKLAHLIVNELGPGQGFVVLTFPLDGSKKPRYVSNGTRESVLKLLNEFVEQQTGVKSNLRTAAKEVIRAHEEWESGMKDLPNGFNDPLSDAVKVLRGALFNAG